MIRWEAPGPYLVAFTTREGGVSRGAVRRAEPRRQAGDEPARGRREPAARLRGARARRLAARGQPPAPHREGGRGPPGGYTRDTADALWTDEPGVPMLAMSADCVPIAIVATDGTPALAVVHAGWRGLAGGVVAAGSGRARRARGGRGRRPLDRALLLRGRRRRSRAASTPT